MTFPALAGLQQLLPRLLLLLCSATPALATDLTVTVRDSKGAPLTDSVVYAAPKIPVDGHNTIEIRVEQSGQMFLPFVSVLPVGSSAFFPNRDGIGHHVYSFSSVKTFELPLSESETTDSVLFDTPGVVTVGCNIHDWMVAYVYVVDSPWYTVTGEDGMATLLNLPAGDYTLHVWHPGLKSGTDIEQPISLTTGTPQTIDVGLDIRPEYFWKPERPQENEEVLY